MLEADFLEDQEVGQKTISVLIVDDDEAIARTFFQNSQEKRLCNGYCADWTGSIAEKPLKVLQCCSG